MDETFDEIYAKMRSNAMAQISQDASTNVNPSIRRMEYSPIRKSASESVDVGKRIMTVGMVKAMAKGGPRPDAVASVYGDATRPTLQSIRKSSSSTKSMHMEMGIDHKKLVEKDWEEYNAFISNTQ